MATKSKRTPKKAKSKIFSNKISPFLWFDNQAEEAMNFYTSIFKNSKILQVSRYPENSPGKAGSVMVASFELEGLKFGALNGGPLFKFNESISFTIDCENQREVDYYWNKLLAGGGTPSQCGWLKDKFGLSWQVIPRQLGEYMSGKDPNKSYRVMQAMLKMTKIEVPKLKDAYRGK